MEEKKKINISAMMKKPHDKEVIQDWDPWTPNTGVKNTVKKAGVTINIWSIKSDKIAEEIVEEVVEEQIKDEKTLFYESLTSRVLTEEKKVIKEPIKIDLKSLKTDWNKTDTNSADKKNNEICKEVDDGNGNIIEKCEKTETNTSEKEEKDLFLNYESDYKKKESRVIETIHKLKKIADIKKLTKTNKIFVISIVMATVLWISFLFYIDPETHSLENYKTSILTIAGREVTQQELLEHQTDIQDDILWQLNQNNLWWYQLDFEILTNDKWEAVYKFDGIEYTSKEYLDAAIVDKLKLLKKEKIKNYLKNKKELSQ